MNRNIYLNANSFKSIFIEMYFNETLLSSGSAFFAKAQGKSLLFTNRHNVTGLNNDTGKPLSNTAAIPNKIKVLIPVLEINKPELGALATNSWQEYYLNLYFDESFEQPVWIEHPLREKLDVVGLIINIREDRLMFNVDNEWHKWEVGSLINVLGFPYGLSADRFPIWVTGYIASEPDIDYSNLPMFLIDCRTRQGQSGSPVIGRFMPGQIVDYKGSRYQAKVEITHILGIYSGRINSESDLGKVWKASVLREIILSGIQVGKAT